MLKGIDGELRAKSLNEIKFENINTQMNELKDSYADILNQLTEMMLLCSENFKTLFAQQDQIMKKLENL